MRIAANILVVLESTKCAVVYFTEVERHIFTNRSTDREGIQGYAYSSQISSRDNHDWRSCIQCI